MEDLISRSIHPCYSERAHFKTGRIHLPVAPVCNIQCNYCKRDINKSEDRPGVAASILKPLEALEVLKTALKKMPQIKVVGIAGPGEPLANPNTFETFRLVHKEFPALIKCVASNGLLLSEKVDELKKVGVSTVTVTINAVDPEVASKIYPFVIYKDSTLTGIEGAKLLLKKQMEGVEKASSAGMLVKINTVLIPEINFNEIEKISLETAKRGAVLHNIIPLIPIYNFIDIPKPTAEQLKEARSISLKFLPQFRVCKQCRADAIGVPGLEKCLSCSQDNLGSVYFHG
ncbi:MAG: radical SAM protein [Candidatus Helarchaeota archaeon]|nr:radical SAM protein [Candidatus Helarchaeota archaeon]